MKLAALYTLFNSTELLASSIEQIKRDVDLIILGSQEVSNAGNEMAYHDAYNIAKAEGRLKEEGRDAFIMNYKPLFSVDRKENERRKLQMMIQVAREVGATHFILMAADHFYIPEEFRKGKELVDLLGHDVTLTRLYTYYKKPTWRLTTIEDYYMTFINKIHKDTRVTKKNDWPFRVDPSIRVEPAESFYVMEDVMLHHYSMVRKDIMSKFMNAAAGQNWNQAIIERYFQEFVNYDINKNQGISYFGGAIVEKTVDNFGLEALDLKGY